MRLNLGKQQQEDIIGKITPLIQQIASERVQAIMNEIQRQQIKAYEDFFQGQADRFDEVLHNELDKDRTRKKIKEIVKEVINEDS